MRGSLQENDKLNWSKEVKSDILKRPVDNEIKVVDEVKNLCIMRTSLRNNGNENGLEADCSLKIRMTDKCGCL